MRRRRPLSIVIQTCVAAVALLLAVDSSPAAAADPPPPDTVIALRGVDNAVWVRVNDGTDPDVLEFDGWTSLGGQTLMAPSVGANGMVTVRGLDGAVWFRNHDDATNVWSPWSSLGGLTNDTPVSDLYGSVYVRGLDGAVWFRYHDDDGGYLGWVSLGGLVIGSPEVAGSGLVVAQGSDLGVWINRPIGSSYSGWSSGGFGILARPTVHENLSGVTIAVRGIDGAAFTATLDTTYAWTSGWRRWGGPIVGSPAPFGVLAIRTQSNQLLVAAEPGGWVPMNGSGTSDPLFTLSGLIVRGLDGGVWLASPGVDGFVWMNLGGQTPNGPSGTHL